MEQNIKYKSNGQAVIVLEETKEGYLYQEVYQDEDGDFIPDSPVKYDGKKLIYDTPPIAIFDRNVESRNKRVEELLAQESLIRDRIQDLKKEEAEAASKKKEIDDIIARHSTLKFAFDFLDGKITHYFVIHKWENRVEVLPLEKTISEYSSDKKLRLVSLQATRGWKTDFTWRLHEYSDGSGSNDREIVPCYSFEEANDLVKSYILEKLNKGEDWRKSAIQFGVEVPVESSLMLAQQELNLYKERLQKENDAAAKTKESLDKAQSVVEELKKKL